MTLRRLLPLLTLIALMFAPFGRVGMAEAMAMPAHDMAASLSHCADMPAPTQHEPADRMIDCMIACAMVTSPAAPIVPVVAAIVAAPEPRPVSFFVGITPGHDPPPPRFS